VVGFGGGEVGCDGLDVVGRGRGGLAPSAVRNISLSCPC
jgi:hypothetical protein